MASTGYKVTIHVYSPNATSIPHAFITINAPGQLPITVGFYPVKSTVYAAGIVKNDAVCML